MYSVMDDLHDIFYTLSATGFGTAFGATPATTSSTSFGFGSNFGAANTQQTPAFGSTFGTPASGATAPTFGTSFGTPAASVAPTFGSASFGTGFGATAQQSTFGNPAQQSTAFGTPVQQTTAFGAPTQQTTAFGTPAQQATAFGTSVQQTSGFGAPGQQPTGLFGSTSKPSLFGTPSTSAPSLFSTAATGGSGLFGSSSNTQTTGLFGSTNTTPGLFGTTTTPSLFGQPATNTPSLFASSTGTGTSFGGGLFGTTTSTAPALFGSTFGSTTTAPSSGFGGFGTTNTGFGGFGSGIGGTSNLFGSAFGAKPAVTQATLPQTQANKNQQVIASVYAINIFNDERDDILKKWNMLQACWGTGKGYYNSSQPPVEYTPQNPFYHFKAIGYNVIPEQDNSDGIIKMVFNKKLEEIRNQQDFLKNGIAGILGNKPNLTVEINQIKAVSDNQTEVKITVGERGVTGTSRKIPASDLSAFLNQPNQKQQLTNVGVTSITPFVTPSKAELEEYLKNPPLGQARMLHQEYQTGLHQAFLEKVNNEITTLKTKHSASIAQISELRQKFLELQHRILRVLVKQECTRKVGMAIQPEEELLRGRFEMIHAQLNVPKQFKSRYLIDADALEDIKQFLKMQQSGIAQLINIVNTDMQSLKIIKEGLQQGVQGNHNS
ncbi:hypothetical protein NQ317_009893 [Molorchus minor]|uniref:Uncharacterized protein n=1 Tax=Molorchus minor TaxID=1323400 RepID=A0ABQ9JM40_9CUCU|nr:hypothetical protein NQ317_009893 [Molorchus minor]